MRRKQLKKSEGAIRSAEMELEEADLQASKAQGCSIAGPDQKRLARRMRREAKRRMSKAQRRRGKLMCDYEG